MKRNKDGITLIALVITIIILIILAGVAISYVIGDNGIITNAMKMEVETAKGELRDHFLLRLNEELVSASADIYATSQDIGTRYNEPALIYYLLGNQNYPDTDHAEENKTPCIAEFENETKNGVTTLTNVKYRTEDGPSKDVTVKTKYRVISTALCPSGDKYGVGKDIEDGNIFTLEAINPNVDSYEGRWELVYYDKDHNRTVLETVSLYMTNQS